MAEKGANNQGPTPFEANAKENFGDESMAKLFQLQQSSELTDFTIKVQRKSLQCHKNVLTINCAYFKTLLGSGMKEAKEGEVTMDTIDYDVLKVVIGYIYGQKILLDLKKIQSAIEICEHLQLLQLKNQLATYALQHVEAESCISWRQFAQKFKLEDLEKKSSDIMMTQMEEVSKFDEFKSLTLKELLDYINSPDIVLGNHDPMLTACIEWVDFDVGSRKSKVLELLKAVKLEECSSSAIKTITKKYKDLISDAEVKCLIYEEILPRLEDDGKQLVIIGGMEQKDSKINSTCWTSQPFSSSWEVLLEIPSGYQANQSPIVCIPGGIAVMCGGSSFKKNTMYDMKEKKWTDLPDMPRVVRETSGLYCNGSIYVLGGYDGKYLDTMFCLDIKDAKWKEVPSIPVANRWPIVENVGNNIFVVYNDYDGKKKPTPMHQYKIAEMKWISKCSLPENAPRTHSASLVSLRKFLYLVGGNSAICARYNISADNWTLLNQPSMNHRWASSLVSNGRIYVCGGSSTGTVDIEEYNIKDDKWRIIDTKLPKGLCFFTAAIVPLV